MIKVCYPRTLIYKLSLPQRGNAILRRNLILLGILDINNVTSKFKNFPQIPSDVFKHAKRIAKT